MTICNQFRIVMQFYWVMLAVNTANDTGWQNTCAGDDYPSAGAGGNRPLLFVIARNGSDEAIAQQDSNNSILPWEIITNTITGLVHVLKGVGKIESLKINIKVQ